MASIKSLVLDAGPLLTQSYSDIQHLSENFYTTPSVHNEIKDEKARQNLLLWGERLVIRQPKPEYIRIVSEFSKKTGDYSALSSTDIQIIALCYEVEVELNNGDWRLRKYPGQKDINANQKKGEEKTATPSEPVKEPEAPVTTVEEEITATESTNVEDTEPSKQEHEEDEWEVVTKKKNPPKKKNKNNKKPKAAAAPPAVKQDQESNVEDDDSDFDDESAEWIGHENLQEALENNGGDKLEQTQKKKIKAAMSSGDFAMQNVALQIGLNLVNPTNGLYIKKIKNYMLRCHACFKLCALPKDGRPLQFCPKCGMDTLLRCTVTVTDSGKLQVHLKKNMQWSHRGDKYSLPTPQSKNARKQRHDNNPILLREDQPEYEKAVKHDMWKKRQNEKMLDEWVGAGGSADNIGTPFAISGIKREATKHTGVRVGQGRYVNTSRRKK